MFGLSSDGGENKMRANRNNSGCWPGRWPAKVGHHVDGCGVDMEGATSGGASVGEEGKKEARNPWRW